MDQLSDQLRAHLEASTVGVLATVAPDGKPRQSLVYFARDDERLLISTLTDRLKARDARRIELRFCSVVVEREDCEFFVLSHAAE